MTIVTKLNVRGLSDYFGNNAEMRSTLMHPEKMGVTLDEIASALSLMTTYNFVDVHKASVRLSKQIKKVVDR